MEEQLMDCDVKNKGVGELYSKTKISKEALDDIKKVGGEFFNELVQENYKSVNLTENEEEQKVKLRECYLNIVDILKKYCDIKEDYYSLIACWIIGTYLHEEFQCYPYLFFNAMKGSGKTRLLKLITKLSKEGEILTSLTEAVLFRTKGTLGIDEFEGLNRKGNENLRELLNASYKKGNRVKRMRKVRTPEGEKQEVESFDVYRPICLANIWGMENVLGDRCITLIVEKSNNDKITTLVEIFDQDPIIQKVRTTLTTLTTPTTPNNPKNVQLCSVVHPARVYVRWNEFVLTNYTTTPTQHYTTTLLNFFNRIKDTKINGRNLELAFPLLIISEVLGEDILEKIIKIIKEIVQDRTEDDFTENKDVALIDFLSQELENDNYHRVIEITENFKKFLQINEEWINSKWVGKSLKRLNLIKLKKRMNRGVEVVLDYKKAQEKIKMFK